MYSIGLSLTLITIISLLTADRSLDLTYPALAEPSSTRFSWSVSEILNFCLWLMQSDAKIYNIYYCDNVLEQELLPDIRSLNDVFLFSKSERRHTVHATLRSCVTPLVHWFASAQL